MGKVRSSIRNMVIAKPVFLVAFAQSAVTILPFSPWAAAGLATKQRLLGTVSTLSLM